VVVKEGLKRDYGITTIIRDLAKPYVADLDGVSIVINLEIPADERVFLTVHLFGHAVQWNTDPKTLLVAVPPPPPVPDRLIPAITEYERDAARYGLQILHKYGIRHLDSWLAAYSEADIARLIEYYKTSRLSPLSDFWDDQIPALDPKPIPLFVAERHKPRSGGIVF
jgi:hypothetical protein